MNVVDDLLIKQANNHQEEVNGSEERTCLEDDCCGVAYAGGTGAAIRRSF